jgi:S-formylglutathione hydrolase FrmB
MPANVSYTRLVGALALALLLATATARASRMVPVEIHSDLLSAFWKQPVTLRADVLLPDSYDRDTARRYPIIYWLPGYGGNYDRFAHGAWGDWIRAFATAHHEAIVAFPDPVLQYAYTEFANSVNTGPWGDAFATELVPYIDRSFRTSHRFIAGHSSGAWAALWQQINYPELFDGAWAYAPDPLDFHDFTGPDLTAVPPGNFFWDARGNKYTFVRVHGNDTRTLEEFAIGPGVGPLQFASFEAVFSPRAADGTPAQLFDRRTGAIDGTVAAYWESHYDAAAIVRAQWAHYSTALKSKMHVIVGTADTFHLDGPTHRFCAVLVALGAQTTCTFLLGGDHASVLSWDGGYERHIIDEIFLTVPE